MNDDVKLVSREAVLGGQNMVSSSVPAGTTRGSGERHDSSPSTERCERRASLASLVLGDELTEGEATSPAPMDDQILVAEVEGEATPSPNPA